MRHASVRSVGGHSCGRHRAVDSPALIGTKLAEFGAEVIHVEKPGGDVFRFTAPQLVRGPRPHGGDEAEVTKNKLSMGLDFKKARGIELLMALWKISDVWMESSAPGTFKRNGITNELALAVNPSLVIVRVSTYGQYGKQEYLGRPGYDAIAQAYGGMMNLTGDPGGPPQRAKSYTGDYVTALTGWAATMMALWEVKKSGRGQVIDLAQYEAVAQTNGNTLPIFTGEGAVYGHTGNRPAGFQPYDTFKCSDGWVFIGALGGAIYNRVPKFLGLDPVEYSYDECSKTRPRSTRRRGANSTDGCASIALRIQHLRWKPRSTRLRLAALACSTCATSITTSTMRLAEWPSRYWIVSLACRPSLRRGAEDVADARPHLARSAVDRRRHH